MKARSHGRRWGAVWILAALFLASWAGQLAAQVAQVTKEARAHGEAFAWADFWPEFLAATLENWQSEYLQLIVQAILLLAFGSKLFRADEQASKEDIASLRAEIRGLRDGS